MIIDLNNYYNLFVLCRNIGITINDTATAAMVPNIKETPNPPNTGSLAKRVLANIIAVAVRKIGFARVAVAYAIARSLSIPSSLIKDCAKSINKIEFRELIPISAIKPISEVAVKKNVSLVKIFIIKCPKMTPIIDKKLHNKTIPLSAKFL